MSSELKEFFAVLLQIARWILDVTLTIICLVLLLFAACVPWRLPFLLGAFQAESLYLFQTECASQFGYSLLDLVLLIWVLPSLLWFPRWPGVCSAVKAGRREVGPLYRNENYDTHTREVWFLHALESYFDLLALPFALALLLAPWRCTSLHTEDLKRTLSHRNTCGEQLSAIRDWAFCAGFGAIIDLPFIAIALVSLCVPTRLMALLSVLFLRHGFHDKTSDWEARCYLLLLPVLSLVDVMAGLLAYAAMLNPLRADTLHQLLSSSWYADPESCCCFDSEVQSAARWNAHLRGIAMKTGLASLMDFLLFPVGLVLGLTVYRAGPLLKALWGYDELGEPILEESLPISRIHAIIMKQFALLLLDLLTLPSLILVLLTGYRCSATQHFMERMRARNYGAMAYHVAVVGNSLVIMHDALLAVCSLTLLLTVYRLPRVIRVLQRQGVSSDSDSGSESDSSTSSSSRMRLKIWQEIGHLLLDLPLLPLLLILLLTVWRADLVLQEIWHAESDCEGRKVVALQFLELLRDMLAFVALLILAVTLVRLPKVLLDIYAQRARPATGTPRLALRSVQVAAPSDDRLTWYVAADQESSRKRNELGVIRINVISQAFWEDIGRVFGTAVSSLGKALLPYTLQEGKHFEYNDLLPQAVQMELKIGGDELKKRLLQLDGDMTMCVQIEHRAPDGTEEVMGRLPIPARVLHDAIRSPETVVQVPEEFIAAARSPDLLEAVCGPLLSGSGIRNGLWICAFRELWQLVLDLLHLLLFLLLLASPLRLMQYLYFAGSSNQAWLRKLTRQMVSVLYLKDDMLRMYRGLGLEPALNAAAKDPPSRTSQCLGDLASKLMQQTTWPTGASLLRELEAHPETQEFAKKALRCSSLQDAVASYWPGLILGANLQLLEETINPHQHAFAIEKIRTAHLRAEQLIVQLLAELEHWDFEADDDEEVGLLCGMLQKSLEEHRHLIRTFVLKVLKDYGALLLGLLLLASMYRVPAMVRGICRENHSMLTHRVRLVLTCQARLLMWDLWMLFTTLLASLLAILTLVRALEFLQVAFLYCKSLQDLRAAAWRAVKDALSSLWELISLLTLWETYTSLVRASICAVLIPAWGLTPLPHWLRIILWLGLCSLPWLLTLQRAVIIFGALEVVLFTINLLRKGCQTCQTPSAYLNAMRMTGINGLVLVFVVGEGVMLASVEYLEPLFMNWTWFIVATCVGVLWLIVMSLPHAMSSSIESCVDAVKFHMAIQLLRRCCLLPAAVVFLSQMDPQAQDATSRAAGMLLAFLSFTAVLGWDLLCQEHLPENLGLDLVQPPAFLAGFFFAQVAFVHQQLHGNLTTCFVASLLMPVWILSFQLVSGSIGGPLWLMPLQLAASCLVSYLAWARLVHFNHQWAGAACLALLAALGFLAAWWLARRWRRQASSGAAQVLKQLLDRLAQKGAQLEAATLVETKGEDLSPEEGAMQLEVLEKGTRMEYLSKSFLSTRHDWLSSLRAGRRHFDVVVTCGTALLEAICTPPSTLQIFSLMRRKSGRRVPTAIWQIILEFVSDVKYMSKMLNPVVQNFNSGGPDRQLMRAWELMNGVGVRVRSFELTRGQAPLFVPQNFRSLQGFPVTVLDERGPWRGRITKVWRDCVEVKSALSGWQNVFVFSDGRVQVLSQSPEDRLAEDLHFWTLLVHRDLRDVCPCGRPRKGEHSNCCRKCYRRYRPNWVSNGYGDLGHTAGCEERTAGLEPYQAYNLEDERSGGAVLN